MNSFEWVDARRSKKPWRCCRRDAARARIAKAGGMDLLDLMKEGIVAAGAHRESERIDALRGVQFADAAGLRLGALVTLAEIASNSSIRQHYPALAEAAAHAATPQVRNAATIGGNLLQTAALLVLPQRALPCRARRQIGSEDIAV